MKKLFIAIMAVAAAVSCSTELTVDAPKGAAIAFDNAFVENATKAAADISAANLADFGVYGSIINAEGAKGMIFNNQTVAKSGDAFTYSPAQYWVAATTYNFVALAPQTAANWTYANEENDAYNGVISFNNAAAAGEQDLLFASHGRTTDDKLTAAPEKVAFTFNHMLSRVKFTFTNGFHQGSNVTLKVTDVTITNAHAEGTLAVANGVVAEDWTGSEATFARLFGNLDTEILAENGGKGATEHYYLLPTATAIYDITFTVALYQAGVLVDTYNRNATISLDLEKGKSYNLQATLNQDNTSDEAGELYPIEFNATVNDWAAFGDETATVKEVVKVATAAELTAAIEAGNNVALTADINLDDTRAAAAGLILNNDVVIEGAGHTLTTSAVRAIQIIDAKNVTIKNLTLNAGGERGIQLQGEGQTLVVDNVTVNCNNYALNLTSSCQNANVTVNNSALKGLNVVNVWASNTNITINDTTLTCEDNNANEGYNVISNNGDNTAVTVNGGEVVITGSNAADTTAGGLNTTTATITFNGTVGDCVVDGHYFAINYGDYRYTFSTWAEAYDTAKEGETIVLTQNVTLEKYMNVSKSVTLDLNGHNIVAPKTGIGVAAGTLTINGEGTVEAGEQAVWVYGANANVIINGGHFVGSKTEASDVIYVNGANSKVTINGGKFEALVETTEGFAAPQYSLLNLAGSATGASIVVYGGSYKNFNPANNVSEGANTNFVAEGKTVTEAEGWYTVE